MKKTLLFIFVSFAFISAHAQLANTKWKGTLQLDNPTDVIFDFSMDSLKVSAAADNGGIETMKYTVKDTVLTIQKVYGQSDCDSSAVARYRFEIKDDDLYLTLMGDDCDDRAEVLDNTKWMKMP